MTSLKYFAEEAPEYHVIGAGSLLGVALNRGKYSFPVGKVQIITMYPMDFEEYLWARGEEYMVDEIRKHFESNVPFSEAMHIRAVQFYHDYLMVGGMPAVVLSSLQTKNVIFYADMQELILAAYMGDMPKYTINNEAVRIQSTYDSMTTQLARDNKKFQFKLIKSGARTSQYGDSIDWLVRSGIVLQCTKCEQGYMPPNAYRDLSSFKLYFSDIGLLFRKSNMRMEAIANGEHNLFTGALIENYIACELKSNGYELLYWASENTAEVDFIIVKDDAVIPIESKAGTHVKAKSLMIYHDKYHPPYAIRISERNFGMQNGIKAVPLYAVFCV